MDEQETKINSLRNKLEPLIDNIEKEINSIQLQISQGLETPYLKEELNRLTYRKNFLKEQWDEAEKYGTLDKNIYEHGSIDYYRQKFESNREYLDTRVICITQDLLEEKNVKPAQKIKMLKNLMKVYEEIKQMINL